MPFGCLLALASVVAYARTRPFALVYPCTCAGWAGSALFLGLGAAALSQALPALASRTAHGAPVDLIPVEFRNLFDCQWRQQHQHQRAPRNARRYSVTCSCISGAVLWLDIIKIDCFGLRANGVQTPQPSRYRIYGAIVSAPYAAEILIATDALPDMQVPHTDRVHMAGNYLCAGAQLPRSCLGTLHQAVCASPPGTR